MNQQTTIQLIAESDATVGLRGGHAYRLAPDVLFLKAWDGSARLIDLGGDSYGLPEVSTTLLELTLREGPDAAAVAVARRSRVPVERVRADLESFLGDIHRRGLLARRGNPVPRRGTLRGAVARPLAWAIRLALRSPLSDGGKARAALGVIHVGLQLVGWPATVELCREASRLDRGPVPGASDSPDRLARIDRAVREAVACCIFPVDCKARALCCWLLIRSAGLPARLVVGVDLFPFLGHCWCESGAVLMADRPERCGRFHPVLNYV